MKVKDVRLHRHMDSWMGDVVIHDQEDRIVCVVWCKPSRTKPQAIAIAKRLCDRFNAGQEGK